MTNGLLEQATKALSEGKTLLYPTDTIWGIGCDATCAEAVERIYAIKERDHSKSMLILATADMLSPDVPQEVRALLLENDRPTTVVLPASYVAPTLPDNLLAADGTVGVRVPRMDFCQTLLRLFGRPIVSTSANLSGHPSPQCYADIWMRFFPSFGVSPQSPISFIRLNGRFGFTMCRGKLLSEKVACRCHILGASVV